MKQVFSGRGRGYFSQESGLCPRGSPCEVRVGSREGQALPRRRSRTKPLTAAIAAWIVLAPATARAQACCAAAGLVVPARLRLHEEYGAGLQVRGRTIFGSFDPDGTYHSTAAGDIDGEQDLFAAIRLLENGQVAVLIPFLITRRSVPGVSEWGSGIGDVSLTARYDFTVAGQYPRLPGLALLLGLVAPTGRPADEARNTLATDATGTGTWEGSVGVSVEQSWGHTFAALDGWIGQRTPRSSQGIRESFEPHLTALLAGGYVFDSEISLGAFVTANWQGAGHDRSSGQQIPNSATSLCSAGGALVVPLSDAWRAQGTISVNGPVSGFGRNQLAGVGATFSILRAWL